LTDAIHQVETRGPEGEQDVKDEKGKPVKSGMRVAYTGYRAYIRKLMGEAGLIDVELEAIVDQLVDTDRKMNRIERVMGSMNS